MILAINKLSFGFWQILIPLCKAEGAYRKTPHQREISKRQGFQAVAFMETVL